MLCNWKNKCKERLGKERKGEKRREENLKSNFKNNLI